MKFLYYYRYLFYKVLSGLNKIPFNDDTNHWGAIFILSFLTWFNMGTIYVTIIIFTGEVPFSNINRIEQTIIALSVVFIHYISLLNKQRYKIIMNEFKNESDEKRKKSTRYSLIYIIGTIVIFLVANTIKLIIWGKP